MSACCARSGLIISRKQILFRHAIGKAAEGLAVQFGALTRRRTAGIHAHPGSARPRRALRTVNSVKSPTSLSTVSVPPTVSTSVSRTVSRRSTNERLMILSTSAVAVCCFKRLVSVPAKEGECGRENCRCGAYVWSTSSPCTHTCSASSAFGRSPLSLRVASCRPLAPRVGRTICYHSDRPPGVVRGAATNRPTSILGHERTHFAAAENVVSHFPKADMCGATRHVHFVPKANMHHSLRATRQHAQKLFWNCEAYGLSSLEIDHQFELRRLNDRQIGRLVAPEARPV